MHGTLVKLIKLEMRENTAFNLFDMAYLTYPLLIIREYTDFERFKLHLKYSTFQWIQIRISHFTLALE